MDRSKREMLEQQNPKIKAQPSPLTFNVTIDNYDYSE